MDVHNFQLNSIFQQNAKKYQTRPVIAAKYQLGMENGWMVYFTNKKTQEKESMMHEGVQFFSSIEKAWKFINANEKQYIMDNGELVAMEVIYDPPKPVLCRKDADAINKDGILLCFGEYAFVSDESCDYEFYILESDCWIIQDMNSIRVWYPDSEETFFGKSEDIVFKKVSEEEYVQVAV